MGGYGGPPLYPLIVFFIVIVLVVVAVVRPSSKWYFDYCIPPVIGAFALLIDGTLTLQQLWDGGVVGDSNISPYHIVIIFISLAYLCISLDLTGVLAHVACKVAKRAGSSAPRLFTAFYLLSSAFTVITSNDIVILTLTPLIVYTAKNSGPGVDALPMLIGQFLAANICSMCLLIGNPTNIIVGEANNLTFLEYSKWMLLPALSATLACYLVLVFVFWGWKDGILAIVRGGRVSEGEMAREATREQHGAPGSVHAGRNAGGPSGDASSNNGGIVGVELVQPTTQPPVVAIAEESLLVDREGAFFCGAMLAITLVAIAVLPYFVSVDMYMITAVAAAIVLVRNLICWPWRKEIICSPPMFQLSVADRLPAHNMADGIPLRDVNGQREEEADDLPLQRPGLSSSELDPEPPSPAPPQLPYVHDSLMALPWRIIPFVLGMFVLVAGLDQSGWISALAANIAACLESGNVGRSLFVLCCLTIALSNVINNQPATILLTRVIISNEFRALPDSIQKGAMFGVIAGSNMGANFTLLGALAGIMFHRIVTTKGIKLTYAQFSMMGFRVMPLVVVLAMLILWAEFAVF